MSEVSPLGGGAGVHGYITDPPSAPGPGDRYLSDPPAPPAAGDRYLSDAPAPPAEGDRFLSDPPRAPAGGDHFLSDPPRARPGDRLLSDPPAPLAEGDRFLSAPETIAEPVIRLQPTAGDHAVRTLNSVGSFFGDLWEKDYGGAITSAGQAITEAGATFQALLFGDDTTKPAAK